MKIGDYNQKKKLKHPKVLMLNKMKNSEIEKC